MVASVASLGGLGPAQGLRTGLTARAVAPAAPSPILRDRPRPPQAPPASSAVAFAPAAMSALIEAQERLSHPAAPIVREQTNRKIDALIVRLAGSPAPTEAPFGVRRLEAARQALTLAPVGSSLPTPGILDLRA